MTKEKELKIETLNGDNNHSLTKDPALKTYISGIIIFKCELVELCLDSCGFSTLFPVCLYLFTAIHLISHLVAYAKM